MLKLSGIVPSRRLLCSARTPIDFLMDNIGGIDPVSCLLLRTREFDFGIAKKLCGMVPDILLPFIVKYDNSVHLSSGIR